jgi:hypothetical protein
MDTYEVVKALGGIEQRINRIEDRLTGAASFAMSRQHLNMILLDELRWAAYEVRQAKDLVSTLTNSDTNSAQNDNKEPVNPSA